MRTNNGWRKHLVAGPILFLLFEVLWGINYGQRPVESKIGYAKERVTPERFRELVVARLEGEAVPCARRPKTLLLNAFFRWNGIHGITSPFTREAHHRWLVRCLRPSETVS